MTVLADLLDLRPGEPALGPARRGAEVAGASIRRSLALARYSTTDGTGPAGCGGCGGLVTVLADLLDLRPRWRGA